MPAVCCTAILPTGRQSVTMLARCRSRQWNYWNVTFITTVFFFKINKSHQTKRIISKTCSLRSKRFRRVGEQECDFRCFARAKHGARAKKGTRREREGKKRIAYPQTPGFWKPRLLVGYCCVDWRSQPSKAFDSKKFAEWGFYLSWASTWKKVFRKTILHRKRCTSRWACEPFDLQT